MVFPPVRKYFPGENARVYLDQAQSINVGRLGFDELTCKEISTEISTEFKVVVSVAQRR